MHCHDTFSIVTDSNLLYSNSTIAKKKSSLRKTVPKKLYNDTATYINTPKKVEQGGSFIHPSSDLIASLPQELKDRIQAYRTEFENGDLTEYGLNRSVALVYSQHLEDLSLVSFASFR